MKGWAITAKRSFPHKDFSHGCVTQAQCSIMKLHPSFFFFFVIPLLVDLGGLPLRAACICMSQLLLFQLQSIATAICAEQSACPTLHVLLTSFHFGKTPLDGGKDLVTTLRHSPVPKNTERGKLLEGLGDWIRRDQCLGCRETPGARNGVT